MGDVPKLSNFMGKGKGKGKKTTPTLCPLYRMEPIQKDKEKEADEKAKMASKTAREEKLRKKE